MSKVKLFVVEDNEMHKQHVEMLLEQMGYDFAGAAKEVDYALSHITAVKPDLILVDIDLNGDRDGIQLVEEINQKNPIPAIFVTALKDTETIERAKLTSPYAYIIKPYEKETLQAAIELAVYRFAQDIDVNKNKPSTSGRWKEDQLLGESFFIKSGVRLIKIDLDKILFIEVMGKFCTIHTPKETIEARVTLNQLSEKLTNKFLRVHRSFIIHTDKIDEINLQDNCILMVGNNIPISRTYRDAFIKRLSLGKV